MSFNLGDLKAYLSGGKNPCPYIKGYVARATALDSADGVAKTLLKKTLTQHDAMYHKSGYKAGDSCNFRDALAKGDPVDVINLKKDDGEEKVGLVKYVEKSNGEKKIVGVEEVDTESAEVSPMEAGDSADKRISRYLTMVGDGSLSDHDKRFHPAGYREGEACNLRDKQAKVDKADDIDQNKKAKPLSRDERVEIIRGALDKFSYKTNMGNKVEYTEQGAWDDHELTIKGYKESQGWGGGSDVKISNQLGDKMANEIGKKFKVSKWNVDNEGSLHLQGDFGENGFIG